MPTPRLLGAAILIAAGTAMPASADVIEIIGGTLRVHNPSGPGQVAVQATFLGDTASLNDNELFLDAPAFMGPIFNNHTAPVGATASIGSFLPETVLFIRNQSFYIPNPGGPASYNFGFFTGTGLLPLNPDRLPHAILSFDTEDPDAGVTVRFEDQFGGGDADFNDAVYSFTNTRIGFVDVALSPIDLGPGDSVTVNEDEERYLSGFESAFGSGGEIINGGRLTNYGAFENSGTFDNLGEYFNDIPGSFHNLTGAQFTNSGTMTSFGPTTNDGEIHNDGTLNMLPLLGVAGPIFANTETGKVIASAASEVRNGGRATNAGDIENAGDWVNAPGSELENTGNVINAGNFTVSTGASMTGDGTYGQITGGLTTIDGTLEAATIDIQAGTVDGTGTASGGLNVGSDATVAPGRSPGTLTVDGDFTLDGGTLAIELASTTEFDVLAITGTATFTGGTVEYQFLGTPVAGDSYTWLTAAGGITGADSLSESVGGAPAGLAFRTASDGTSLTLLVLADGDGDAVADDVDNCTAVANPDQRDTNDDGFGNLCDADLDDNGFVNFADLSLFRARFGGDDADADFDGSGSVNFEDLSLLRASFGRPPGPSATAIE